MCSPSPPPAPNYVGAAQAQGAANLEAAQATAKLNNPNIIGPGGTRTVTYGSNQPFVDQAGFDAAMAAFNDRNSSNFAKFKNQAPPNIKDFTTQAGDPNIPTVRETLSPANQNLYDTSQAVKQQLADLSSQGASALQGVVGKNLDLSGIPQTGNYNSTRDQVINSMMSRVNTDTANARDQKNSDLVAAGIHSGTKAYDDQMALIDRGYNDARNQAEISGGNAAAQAYGIDSNKRQQAIAELLAQRQTPLNEISALTSGSQVANPFTQGYQGGAGVQPAPVANAIGQLGNYGTDVYNQEVGSSNANKTAGASALLSAAYLFSDMRLKTNIRRIDTHKKGFGIYLFRYLWDKTLHIGVMAQEVLPIIPEAVHRCGEYYLVDYSLIWGSHGRSI